MGLCGKAGETMTDCKSWVFHHQLYNLNNLFSWIFGDIKSLWSLVFTAIFLLSALPQHYLTICLATKHIVMRCACVHECVFLCVPLPISPVLHHVETWGLFCILYFLSFFSPFPVPSVPHKKQSEMESYGGNYFREPCLSSIPPPPLHPHISILLYPTPTTTLHALKREGEDPLCLNSPFKQKTSSDLERPTTLLSCALVCVCTRMCKCVQSLLFSLSDKALGHFGPCQISVAVLTIYAAAVG